MTKPLRVSWSAMRNHEDCHQRSYLIREGKKAKVTNIRNFYPGMCVDQIMRDWLDNPLIRHADTRATVRAAMDHMESSERGKGNMIKWRDAEDRATVENFCVELINRLEPILEQQVLPFPYEHGKWFKVPMTIKDQNDQNREIVLTGEMDLLVDNAGPVVWDLKGTADNQYWRKVVAQLTFYDLAIWAGTGVKTRFCGLIQPMCDQQLMAWEITDDARRNLLTRIVRYAHDVWAGENACTGNAAACFYCDVRHACSRYSNLDSFGTLADALRTAAGDPA